MHILIIGEGDPPHSRLFAGEYKKADLLIAADGGAHTLEHLQAIPDLIIGDMDSYRGPHNKAPILKVADQETSDMEKALQYACNHNADTVCILGATGRRLDHTLKNISILQQFSPHFKTLEIKDNYGISRILEFETTLQLPVGTTVSLFPLSGTVHNIFLEGFAYPLFGETLQNGVRDGTSNRIVHNPARISYSKGTLLMFVKKNHPYML